MTVRRTDPYDAKCHEWDGYYFIGDSPTAAAHRRPGEWQLVYDLRPLELIPYWLGIPFKPHHPVAAVIYDANSVAYFTAPAIKIAELGRPSSVCGTIPLMRLLYLSVGVDRFIYRTVERVGSVVVGVLRFVRYVEVLMTDRRREERHERSQIRAA